MNQSVALNNSFAQEILQRIEMWSPRSGKKPPMHFPAEKKEEN